MLNFFRKTRKEFADDNKFIKYSKYAIGEILLVVIGILIALQINNWNEERKIRILERAVLIDIKKSLLSDIENQIDPNLEQLNQDMLNIKHIRQLLNGEMVYNDSMNTKFRSLMFSKRFSWEVTAFKVLENQGVNIISDPKLKQVILRLYNMSYPEANSRIGNFLNNLKEFFRPEIRKNFAFNYINQNQTYYEPINIDELINNQIFKNTVETAYLNFLNNHLYHKELKEEVKEVIELIEHELNSTEKNILNY
jgi:uncharacterized membrane protein YgaE (UPF0421/DUF939 family)